MSKLYAHEAVTGDGHTVIIPLHQIISLVEELNTVVVAGLGANGKPLVYQLTEEDFQIIKSHFVISRYVEPVQPAKSTKSKRPTNTNKTRNGCGGPPYAC